MKKTGSAKNQRKKGIVENLERRVKTYCQVLAKQRYITLKLDFLATLAMPVRLYIYQNSVKALI